MSLNILKEAALLLLFFNLHISACVLGVFFLRKGMEKIIFLCSREYLDMVDSVNFPVLKSSNTSCTKPSYAQLSHFTKLKTKLSFWPFFLKLNRSNVFQKTKIHTDIQLSSPTDPATQACTSGSVWVVQLSLNRIRIAPSLSLNDQMIPYDHKGYETRKRACHCVVLKQSLY